ncbi:MAG: hypothetical protein FWE14_00580 [Lachnospiraceae bacterium]|nr:hypothetical protein [Lachnospiraceae bacterium]
MNITNDYLEFEKEHNLLELEYRGVYFWYLIRQTLTKDLFFGKDSNFHPDFLAGTKNERRKYIKHIPGQIKQFFDRKQYDILISCVNIERMIQGKLANPHTYFFEEYDFSIKHNTLFTDRWPDKAPEGTNSALMRALLFLYSKYHSVLWKFKKDEKNQINHYLTMFEERFSCSISHDKYMALIDNVVCSFKLMKWYYLRMINNKYRAIFISDSHCIEHYSLIAAARQCKIPTIEYQHGVIGLGDVKYNFLSCRETGNYFPDYLFTYGEFWDSVCSLPEKAQAIAVGSPLFDNSKKEYAHNIMDDKVVVYISTGFIGADLSKHAISFARLTESLGYRIIYKFHPSECKTWRQRYPWLAKAEAELNHIECIDQPVNIYEVLSRAKHVVSVASTVIFEAISFGCKIYIWDKEELKDSFGDIYEEIVNRGYVDLFETENELLSCIKSKVKNDVSEIGGRFYKSGSSANIRRELTLLTKDDYE